VLQCGHPLHKLNVSAEEIDSGSVIWDVTQVVPLSAVQVRYSVGTSPNGATVAGLARLCSIAGWLTQRLRHAFCGVEGVRIESMTAPAQLCRPPACSSVPLPCCLPALLAGCLQEKAVPRDALLRSNAKLERIKHATIIAAKLPPAFRTHTPREAQLLAAAAAFCGRWLAGPQAADRLAPCLALPNECGTLKAVCTTLRPTALPHVNELHDLEAIAQVCGWCVGVVGGG
jgi:hypothetical protein